MELKIAENGVLLIDNAHIIYTHFSGVADEYHREGERDFKLIIPSEEMADILANNKNKDGVGWNVNVKPPRTEEDDPFFTMKVKLAFRDRIDGNGEKYTTGPNIYLVSGNKRKKLTKEDVGILDDISIANVSMDVRPYDGFVQGKPFRSAWLNSMEVVQNIDRFEAKYAEEEFPEE